MYNKIATLMSTLLMFSASFLDAHGSLEQPDPEFVVLVTSYNNEQYCERNLASIVCQKSSKPFQVIVVNDCSTDRTKELLEAYVKKHHLESFVKLIHNTERCYSLKNIYTVIHTFIEDHKIVVSVDGDDQLASDRVLLRLEQEYKKGYIHLTYGGRVSMNHPAKWYKRRKHSNAKIPDAVIKAGTIRKTLGFKAEHLKTFRAGLFKLIKKEDLMYKGEFLKAAGDVAFMYPMIDMLATPGKNEPIHVAYIPDVLYLYNIQNPLNVFKKNRAEQHFLGPYIASKKPYSPIDTSKLPTKPRS